MSNSCVYTTLAQHYTPFDYKPTFTICQNLLRRCTISNFAPSAIHGKFNKNGRILQLRQRRGKSELTYHPIKNLPTYWPAIQQPSYWLRSSRLVASWWWCKNCIASSDCTHSAPSLIHDHLATELSHYEVHRKPHKTVTDNSAIAVSLAHSTVRKGGI